MRTLPAHVILSGALLLLAVVLRVSDPEPIARLRLSIFDSYQRLAPRVPAPELPVRIVDIDETSLARIGQWPWPRTRLADIVDRLEKAGARTVAIDLILAEPDRLSPAEIARQTELTPELEPLVARLEALPSNDEKLAAAISGAPIVLGVAADATRAGVPEEPRARFAIAGDDPKKFVPRFPGGIGALPVLAAKAQGLGAVNWLPASDHVVRRVPLLLTMGGTLYPSLSVEALRVAANETTLFVRSSGGSGVLSFGQQTGVETVRVGSTVLPTDADGQLWLKYARFEPKRYIPAYTVLDGTFDPAAVASRHVMIGASATGLLDLRATPLDASVPGVEIHAQALEQMLSQTHLVRPALATGAEVIFLLAAGALVAWLIGRSGPVIAALTGAGAIAAVAAGSWLAFAHAGYLFDPVYPALALVALYLSGSLFTYIRTETDRARIRSAFGHYVAAPLVDELARNPEKLKLGGEMREITLLFADVRGFSRLSEGMDAEELIRFVNRLFTPLSDIILAERGTIDKFMGDAVMAFWNAPVPDPQHAANACRAALRMIGELERMNRAWADAARTEGRRARHVRIGIGLNTGRCCVGNVGSPQRFDYSILGDAVNVAARLEETTKAYGVPIIAGEQTARQAKGFAFLDLDAAALRGKDRPERLFALIGDETAAASARFQELAAANAVLRAALAEGDQMTAAARLGEMRSLGWDELETYFDMCAERLIALAR